MHELHIWQLSETKLIATVHILIEKQVSYMTIASDIRKLLHTYGIHSTTIQPEFDAQISAIASTNVDLSVDPGSGSNNLRDEIHHDYEANETVC